MTIFVLRGETDVVNGNGDRTVLLISFHVELVERYFPSSLMGDVPLIDL